MQFFETLLLATCLSMLLFRPFCTAKPKNWIAIGFISILFVIHTAVEGIRWQMLPIYLVCVFTVLIFSNEKWFNRKGRVAKFLIYSVLFLFVGLGTLLSVVFPVFNFPAPTGEYSIGSQYIHLKTNQDEIMTSEEGDKRELMIKAWYPAILAQEETEAYLNKGDRVSFAVKYGLPKGIFNYLDNVRIHTYVNPSVAKGSYPVLIFSHGSYSQASGYYALIEEIVSHGYIVLNINHTYESTGTLFPDGEIKLYNSEYDRKHNNHEMAEMIWIAMQNYAKATTPEEQFETVHDLILNYYGAEVTERYGKDISLVVDELKNWNTYTFLSQHIDTMKIGVFGHSQGGAAAGQALLDDDRIKAGFNIDGMQWGRMIDTMMSKPFALLSSNWDESHPNLNIHAYRNGSSSDFYNAKILNTGHSNFMDIPFMITLPFINEAGTIDPARATNISTKVVIQFFDKYLKNSQVDILKLENEFDELQIELSL